MDLRVAGHEIAVLRSIVEKLFDSAGMSVRGKRLNYAFDEYAVAHPFTPEELEYLGRLVEVIA
jgi:hypothetical protein